MSKTLIALLLLTVAALGARSAANEPAALVALELRLKQEMTVAGTNVARLFALADTCHDLGVTGDKEAVVRAEEYLRSLLVLAPTNAPGLALLGSVFTMKARDAFWPNVQLRLVREGNEFMDRAVKLAPEDIQTRTIRVLNNAHMPDFLGRVATVRADLEWLWERIDREASQFTPTARQDIALHWGRQLVRLGRLPEAIQVWRRGAGFPPESKTTRDIAAELAKNRQALP